MVKNVLRSDVSCLLTMLSVATFLFLRKVYDMAPLGQIPVQLKHATQRLWSISLLPLMSMHEALQFRSHLRQLIHFSLLKIDLLKYKMFAAHSDVIPIV